MWFTDPIVKYLSRYKQLLKSCTMGLLWLHLLLALALCGNSLRINEEIKMFRVQRHNRAAQLQICSSTQRHYRKLYRIPTIKLATTTLGNHRGNTRMTMTGAGWIGITVMTLLYSTYRNVGWTSVSMMDSGPRTTLDSWSTPHSPEQHVCGVMYFFQSTTIRGILSQMSQHLVLLFKCHMCSKGIRSKRTQDVTTREGETCSMASLANAC